MIRLRARIVPDGYLTIPDYARKYGLPSRALNNHAVLLKFEYIKVGRYRLVKDEPPTKKQLEATSRKRFWQEVIYKCSQCERVLATTKNYYKRYVPPQVYCRQDCEDCYAADHERLSQAGTRDGFTKGKSDMAGGGEPSLA